MGGLLRLARRRRNICAVVFYFHGSTDRADYGRVVLDLFEKEELSVSDLGFRSSDFVFGEELLIRRRIVK